jgi:hypothetical protein
VEDVEGEYRLMRERQLGENSAALGDAGSKR